MPRGSRSLLRPTTTHAALIMAVLLALVMGGQVHAATYVVTNANDSGPGSLRLAIGVANANAGADSIHFNIAQPGPHTIRPMSALPVVTDTVVVDGYTHPGAFPATETDPATLMIELDGSLAGSSSHGLRIAAGWSTIRGLVINRFHRSGILVDTNGRNIVEGNYIGTDVSGAIAAGNEHYGVEVLSAPENTLGGSTVLARNVISSNGYGGLWIASDGNVIQGNYIGTCANGTADLGNLYGVALHNANNNTVGGPGAHEGNFIMYSVYEGVGVEGSGNAILGNSIACNDYNGIVVAYGAENLILFNRISSNWLLGIDLGLEDGVTPNDIGDGDSGPTGDRSFESCRRT